MKKIVSLLILGLATFTAVMIFASTEPAVETEPYDEDTYGPEAPVVWTKPVHTVVFYHKTHTLEQGIDCESCHDDLFQMEAGAAEEADDFTMASLYDGNYCGACHDGSTAFASNSRCTSCHIGVRGHARLQGADPVAAHEKK